MRRFLLLCARSGREFVRDPSLLAAQLILVLLIALLLGGFASDLPRDFTGVQTRVFLFNFMVLFFALLGMSSIGSLVSERHTFARERANGFYSTPVYAVAKSLVCDILPLRVVPPLIFGTITYNCIGLNGRLDVFLTVLVLVNVAASVFCMLVSAVCHGVSAANLLAAAFFLYSYMFSGLFMVGNKSMISNVKYSSVLFYAWEALVANEFPKSSHFRFNPAGVANLKNYRVSGDKIVENFGLDGNRLPFDCIALGIFISATFLATVVVLHMSKFRR